MLNIFDKLKLCKIDVEEFKDFIQVNDTSVELLKRYSLLEGLSGAKLRNRVENLIIACWSAKDHLKKDIANQIDEGTALIFEKRLFDSGFTHLIQYLADSFKHSGIDSKYLKYNQYKNSEPRLEYIVLQLSNQSFPGELKPVFKVEGEFEVPAFFVENFVSIMDGETYFNYDTILLTIRIVDKSMNQITDTTNLVNEYLSYITKLYNRFIL